MVAGALAVEVALLAAAVADSIPVVAEPVTGFQMLSGVRVEVMVAAGVADSIPVVV